MKIPKEYVFFLIIGLFSLSYVFDALVNPLDLRLANPYQYLRFVGVYPFSTASVLLRGLALFLSPLWLLWFVERQFMGKAIFLFVLGSVAQLYALQDVVTAAEVIPLEWSLPLAFSGLALFVPASWFALRGVMGNFRQNLHQAKVQAALEQKRRAEADEQE